MRAYPRCAFIIIFTGMLLGMWALFQVKKCKALKACAQLFDGFPFTIFKFLLSYSLKELVLEDGIHGKMKKSLLFKLSQNGVLNHFRRVILVSAPKDQYVPSYSARIQVALLLLVVLL